MSYKVNHRGDGRGVYRDYHCNSCEATFEKRLSYEVHKELEENGFIDLECPNCETRGYVVYRPAMPMVTSASKPMGFTETEEIRNLKEAAKLEVKKASMRPSERGEIQREINNLKMTNEKRKESEGRTAKKYTG